MESSITNPSRFTRGLSKPPTVILMVLIVLTRCLSFSLHPSSSLPLSTFSLLYRNIKLAGTRKVGRRRGARCCWCQSLSYTLKTSLTLFLAPSRHDYPFSFLHPPSSFPPWARMRVSHQAAAWFRGMDRGERRMKEARNERESSWRKRGGKKGSSTRPISVHILAGTRALSRSVISSIVCQRPKGKDRWLLLTASLIGWNRFNSPLANLFHAFVFSPRFFPPPLPRFFLVRFLLEFRSVCFPSTRLSILVRSLVR